MEKPLEALLIEQDITLPFCLCWANEPWTRSLDGGENNIIMPQNYGDKKDWEKHIKYLLRFSKMIGISKLIIDQWLFFTEQIMLKNVKK